MLDLQKQIQTLANEAAISPESALHLTQAALNLAKVMETLQYVEVPPADSGS